MNAWLDNSATILQSEALSSMPWLAHAVTTRHFNASADQKPDDLQRLAEFLHIKPSAIAWCDQVHEDSIALLTSAEPTAGADQEHEIVLHHFQHTDAIITNQPGVMISVFTADCLPVFIVDRVRKIIAVVHAGWKGTLLGIVEKAVQTLRYLRAEPRDLLLWLGPAIGRCCYEIGAELMNEFHSAFPEFHGYFDGRHLDLIMLNTLQARRAGVLSEHISSSPFCTRCQQDLFFSYRGDPQNQGRMISTMMIRAD
jgi:YfiH family protein